MLNKKNILVVLPAYRAEKTLEKTYSDIPHEIVDDIILVDDHSDDRTVDLAQSLGIRVYVHYSNLGYGANQKTCYSEALKTDADIIVMVHPDYQYDPRLITAMAAMVASEIYDVVLGSRILCSSPMKGGMPLYKYLSNRFLTLIQNFLLGTKISEFHTGYRAFSRKVLETLPLLGNSDDFVFDNQMLTQCVACHFSIGEISCPTKYFPEASSINFGRSIKYGFGVLKTSINFRMWKWGLLENRLFEKSDTLKLSPKYYNQND